jgi:hypothetical protein
MTKQKRTQYRVISLVSLSLIIAAATYGFAQANTISGVSGMGAGYGVKSSYEVSKVSYTLSKKGEITWTDDCEKIGAQWTCSFDQRVDVLAADWLHVTSAQ